MLSILLPVRNYFCAQLVEILGSQASKLHKYNTKEAYEYEIIVFEDGSKEEFSQKNAEVFKTIPRLRHIIEPQNKGVAEARSILAREARGEYLLFLDSDVMPISSNFLQTYVDIISDPSQNIDVVTGWFRYKREYPKECTLRYKYGIEVEERTLEDRQKKPYASFISMNMLIKKKIAMEIGFAKDLNFGYEDAVYGYRLEKAGVSILHIDNAVWHNVTETSRVYLKKIERIMQSLVDGEDVYKKAFSKIKVLKTYYILKSLGLQKLAYKYFLSKRERIEDKLCKENPSLKLFSVYKLLFLNFLMYKKKNANKV